MPVSFAASLVKGRRRVQSFVIRQVRQSRYFPRVMTNRLGDDEQLVGSAFAGAVIVYYPDALDNTYQVTPWLPAFETLHAELGVTIVTQDSRVTERFRSLTTIPVTTIARYGTLDDMLSRSDVKLALYVSHAPRNFESLRFTSLMHVYLGHGDSDKGVSASNQLKAYDYAFLPGEPAVERVRSRLMKFDADAHTIVIGQPQNRAIASTPRPDGRTTVLYAPTWEGAQPSVAYSSVLSHGRALVASLLADDRFVVDFRPHPLSGVTSRDYAAATSEVAAMIRAKTDAGHRVIEAENEPLEASFARADLLVCDVSAVSSGWLPSGKPLVVTRPASTQTVEADSGLLAALPRLTVEQARVAASVLWPLVANDTHVDTEARLRADLVRTYLGGLSPEESVAAFVAACVRVAAERDAERARLGSVDV